MPQKTIKTLLFATSSALSFAAFSAQIYWKSTVTEGYIDTTGDSSGWTGGVVPGNGDAGEFNNSLSANTTYTVKIPTEGGSFTFPASIGGAAIPQGTKVVFDATGTKWVMSTTPGTAWTKAVLEFSDASGDIFGIQNRDASKDSDYYGLSLDDGKISYEHDADGYVVKLESGTIDAYNLPGGGTSLHSLRLLYSNGSSNNRVVFGAGTKSVFQSVVIGGRSQGGYVLVEGGEHKIYNGLKVGGWNDAPNAELRITGGTLSAMASGGSVDVGGAACPARIVVSGTGEFTNDVGSVYCPNNSGANGTIELSGNAKWIHARVFGLALGHSGGTGSISMGDNAVFLSPGGINVGDSANGTGSILIKDEAEMSVSTITLSHAANTTSELTMLGGTLKLASNASITSGNGSPFKGGAGTVKCLFDGGTIIPGGNDSQTVQSVPAVELGVNGVTVDTGSNGNVKWSAKTQNAKDSQNKDVAGLFVKDGSGVLIVRMSETDNSAVAPYNGRPLNSEHANTFVKTGTLRFDNQNATDGYCRFGNNVTVNGGATLSTEYNGCTRLKMNTLTLGGETGTATVKLDFGDVVEIDAADGLAVVGSAQVDISNWTSAAVGSEYTVFKCAGSVPLGVLSRIVIYGVSNRDYAWKTATDEGGNTLCNIYVAEEGMLPLTITYANDAVTTNGLGTAVTAIVAEQSGTQVGDITLARGTSVSVAEDMTLNLTGDMTGGGTLLTKSGSGKLVVSGNNSGFTGSFVSQSGTLEVKSRDALGPQTLTSPLVLGNGTFKYSSSDPATFNAALKLSGNIAGKAVILDNTGDLTFNGLVHEKGLLVKKGAGALAFDLPAGTYYLGHDNIDGDGGEHDGDLVLPESGDAPETNTGMYGVTIAEGALKIKGTGADGASKTQVNTDNTIIVGTGYAAQVAPAVVVENARMEFGKGSRHGTIMARYPVASPVPEIHLTNAFFHANFPTFGRHTSTGGVSDIGPTVTMSNSTISCEWNCTLGSAGFASVTLDADDSVFNIERNVTIAASKFNADFHGKTAAFSASYNSGSEGGWIASHNHPQGTIMFRDGASMKTTLGIRFAGSQLEVKFDGGTFEILPHNTAECKTATSTWVNANRGIETTGAGMSVKIAEGSTHDFNFPVKGTGSVTKTGAGTFKLVAPRTAGEKLLQYTGGTVVSNGTLVVDGSLVADGAKSFEVAEGATLDLNESTLASATISGAGVVTNGTLSAATIAYDADAVLTFEDVAFNGALTVDFGCTAENPLDSDAGRAGITVAHYTGGAPVIAKVVPANTGIVRAKAKVECNEGDIVVTVVQSGLQVYIR